MVSLYAYVADPDAHCAKARAAHADGVRESSYGGREQGFSAVEFYTQIKAAYAWS